jgi:Fe2+ or Zn2+ uptake regulation protein
MKPTPAQLKITKAQSDVFEILKKRERKGLTSTASDISAEWGNRSKCYVYRVVQVLVDARLVERYSRRYYKVNLQT